MKRCPQCEFIYEDDQSLCDMDGCNLVHDVVPALLPQGTTDRLKFRRATLRLKSTAVPAVAGLALAALLWIAYAPPTMLSAGDSKAVPGKQSVAQTNPQQIAESSTIPPIETFQSLNDTANPLAETAKTRAAGLPAGREVKNNKTSPDSRLTISRRLPSLPRVPPLPRLPDARVEAVKLANQSQKVSGNQKRSGVNEPRLPNNHKPQSADQKKDSRFGSFLKKTARIIKKPFKF